MSSIFPSITPMAQSSADGLPLCRDVKWDFEENQPVFRGGSPVFVTGLEAVLSWAARALQVVRYRHVMYSRDYGSEVESLLGQAYSGELTAAESRRYVREALVIYPYITDVEDIEVAFEGDTLHIRGTLKTVYGEAKVYV